MSTPAKYMAVSAHRLTPAGGADLFMTQPWAARALAEIIRRLDPHARRVWEPACGPGTMAHGLRSVFGAVLCSDAYLYDGNVIHDFIGPAVPPFGAVDWIISNPPFEHVEAFIRRALMQARRGVAMLLRLGCLDGVGRHELLYGRTPLTVVAPFSERVAMLKGRYEPDGSTAAQYAVFIWMQPALKPERFMARIPGPDGSVLLRPGVVDIPPGTRKRLFDRSDLGFAPDGRARQVMARLYAEGDGISPRQRVLLADVAKAGERGVTALQGVFPGGLLASARMAGLLEHAPALKGDEGDRRFRITEDGRALLAAGGRV